MLLRKLVVVGLVGFVSFAANIATAEDAVAPNASYAALDGVDFVDPASVFTDRFTISLSDMGAPRFVGLAPAEPRREREASQIRGYELSLVTSAVSGFDLAFAQRGGVGFNEQGDIERESHGSELRLGRGLRDMPRDRPSSEPKWYIFAASEDEALIWQPGVSSEFGGSGASFALQDRVEIGDIQAGVTYERYGVQASLAYVEREWSVRQGARNYTEEEAFAGFTLTMRH
jgi:hypothetical protein